MTDLQAASYAAEARYKSAIGKGNTRRTVERLWREWTLAKAEWEAEASK